MPLCPNTYRRGSIYWWRRRFAVPPSGTTRTLAFSLKVRDPRSARILGSGLNAEAGRLARELELGMITFEFAGGVLEGLAARQAALTLDACAPQALRGEAVTTYTAAQEYAMLLAAAREQEAHLIREALHNRAHGGLEVTDDLHARAVLGEKAIGFIYKLVATRGAAAKVDGADATAMAARGLSDELIGFVRRETAFHARREQATSWSLGPTRDAFVGRLVAAGASPSPANIAGLRRATLALFAEQLFDAEQRYASARSPLDKVLAALQDGDGAVEAPRPTASGETVSAAPCAVAPSPAARVGAEVLDRVVAQPAAGVATEPVVPGSERSFTGRIAILAKRKIKLKRDGQKDGWTQKTADQHLSVAALFAKCAGTDDPTRMSQGNVGAYRDFLDLAPKNWGKSSKDAHRTLEEILARCEDLDDDEIGLAPGTVNRHLTQLGNCLAHLKGHGSNIGEITDGMRTSGEGRSRATFTADDEMKLFASATWSGPEVVHGSGYFVPLLAKYEVPRLREITGLETKDVDLARMCLHIRPNRLRGVKNKSSIRRVPIMPELERLGFPEYVEAIIKAGFDIVWPELLLRGTATPMENLYYKSWSLILAEVLPDAGAERKHMHSWRKAGNTVMAGKNINDPLRYQLLGHAYRDINGRHYTEELALEDKRTALSLIPVTTGHIERRPLRLHPGLSR